ncbi:hypothetical protein [Mycolicibacterium sp.]|uniref:hypothetical protein n=1 Tax=Mycolicibacterium sp. TaxID=2320850 RepID=UPI003D13BBEF
MTAHRHHGVVVNLLPTVTIPDADVEDALRRAVAIINPLLHVLWETDPLRLKRRIPEDGDDGVLDSMADGFSSILNAADVPGTLAWDRLNTDARIGWWVARVGALNTVAVAFPGVLGALGRRLPIQDLLGFTSQAVVLCAVARELGVTDERDQVRMLAQVLCDRDLTVIDHGDDDDTAPDEIPRTPLGVARALWKLVGLLDAIGDELAKRPHPRAPFRYLSLLPAVGAIAAYLGEYGALSRAAKAGQRWIDQR